MSNTYTFMYLATMSIFSGKNFSKRDDTALKLTHLLVK